MTPERMAQVEAAIAAQDAAGQPWTNLSIYRIVGGNYAGLSQYLKARRQLTPEPGRGQRQAAPVSAQAVLEAMAQQDLTPLEEELAAAVDAEQAAEARLSVLEEQATRAMLSEAEEIESVRLERRVRNLAAVITDLEQRLAARKEEVDIAGFCAAWLPTVEHKRALYAQFAQDVQQLWQSLGAILAQHQAQLDGIQTLPPKLQRYLLDNFLPETGTLKARVAQAMGDPAWSQVLLNAVAAHGVSAEALMENDPGTRALPPRLIENALNAGRPIERSA